MAGGPTAPLLSAQRIIGIYDLNDVEGAISTTEDLSPSHLVIAMRTVRTEYFLTIGEIAEEYKRNGSDVMPALFNAFWMGRFEPFVREDPAYPLISRRTLLEAWRDLGDHPGVQFSTSLEGEFKELADGDVDVDLHQWIILPAQAAEWTSNDLLPAYDQLANVRISDISDQALTGLKCQFLGAYELLAVCYDLGEPPPAFWLHWDTTRKTSRPEKGRAFQAHARAALLLHQKLAGAQPLEVRREDVLEEAESHGLTEASFDKLWKVLAPYNLRKQGRRRGSKNRHGGS